MQSTCCISVLCNSTCHCLCSFTFNIFLYAYDSFTTTDNDVRHRNVIHTTHSQVRWFRPTTRWCTLTKPLRHGEWFNQIHMAMACVAGLTWAVNIHAQTQTHAKLPISLFRVCFRLTALVQTHNAQRLVACVNITWWKRANTRGSVQDF